MLILKQAFLLFYCSKTSNGVKYFNGYNKTKNNNFFNGYFGDDYTKAVSEVILSSRGGQRPTWRSPEYNCLRGIASPFGLAMTVLMLKLPSSFAKYFLLR